MGITTINSSKSFRISLSDIIFIIFVVLSCGSYVSYNSPIYIDNYNDCKTLISTEGAFSYSEWLFIYLMRLSANIGLEFQYFFFILLGTGFALIHKVVRKYLGSNAWLFYVLFFICPLAECRSAIRNTMSLCIITYAIPFLLKDNLKNKIIYIVSVLLAMGFHQTSAIYFIFLLKYPYERLSNSNRRRVNLVFLIAIFILFMACFIPPIMEPIKHAVNALISDTELAESRSLYFEEQGRLGFILYVGWQCLFIFTLKRLVARRLHYDSNFMNSSTYLFSKNVILLSTMLLFMVFFYKLNSNFFRIFMNLIPINYIAILSLSANGKYNIIYRDFKIILCLSALLLLGWNYSQVFLDENLLSMFTNNWFLSLDF